MAGRERAPAKQGTENRPLGRLRAQPEPEAAAPSAIPQRGPNIQISDEGSFSMNFGPETTDGIDELKKQLDGNPSREDVVFTALQLLTWALDSELIVESPNPTQRNRISGLGKSAAG